MGVTTTRPARAPRLWRFTTDRDGWMIHNPAGEPVATAGSHEAAIRLICRLNDLEKQIDDLEHALLWAIDSEDPAGCAYCAQLGDGGAPLCPAHRELDKLRKRPVLVLEEAKEIAPGKRQRRLHGPTT